jgi:hypothetical protein
MSKQEWIRFFDHLASGMYVDRWVDGDENGHVTLWCRLTCGLTVPHHETYGIWDPMTGDVDYSWTEELCSLVATQVVDKPKQLKTMNSKEIAVFNANVAKDFDRRNNG